MAISFTNLGVSSGWGHTNPDHSEYAGSVSSVSNDSWTPPTSGLIVLWVCTYTTGTPADPTSVSGNNLTWTKIAGYTYINQWRVTLYGADASGSQAGATTVNFSHSPSKASMHFAVVDGTDVANGVAQTFVQTATNSVWDVTNGTITLSAFADTDNRPIAFFGLANQDQSITFETNWTKQDESWMGGSAHDGWRADSTDTTAYASWTTSSRWGGMAAEIKAAAEGGGGGGGADPFGMRGFFGA